MTDGKDARGGRNASTSGKQTEKSQPFAQNKETADHRKNYFDQQQGKRFSCPPEATKKVQKKCNFFAFCIAISELFCIFVMQTNKVTNHLILNAMEKDNRKRVDVYNVTSNGYSFHLKRNGDCSVFCRKDESYRRNTPLQKAISEIIRWARTSGIYFFQWHLEHPF